MKITPDLQRILDLAISLTAEKNYSKLLEKVISECMEITGSDAGTLYILKENKLEFMIMRNNTMKTYSGGDGEPISSMPPVELKEEAVCAYAAIHKTPINIKDVHADSQFDWQGPKKYDAITGYHTVSMLVVPLVDHKDKVIGVLQLINAQNSDGEIIEFSKDNENIVYSISSEAAISLSNMILVQQLRDMIYSFVSALTTAIDQRTPYNANHSYNVARYCDEFAKFMMREEKERTDYEYITDSEREQLVMAALVHDVGKLITPLEIMNKPDRLDWRMSIMETRWKYFKTLMRLDLAEGLITQAEYDDLLKKVNAGIELVKTCNTAGFLDEEKLERLKALKELRIGDRYLDESENPMVIGMQSLGELGVISKMGRLKASEDVSDECKGDFLGEAIDVNADLDKSNSDNDGKIVEFLTDEELHELLVVKGTLTAEERKIIEMHAVYTDKILSEIKFQDDFKLVREFARAHHEYLDGSGYPNGLTAEALPMEVRIMTIADIYDSLTADDRPYKKAVPVDRALAILRSMADEGKLDRELVGRFCEYIGETY